MFHIRILFYNITDFQFFKYFFLYILFISNLAGVKSECKKYVEKDFIQPELCSSSQSENALYPLISPSIHSGLALYLTCLIFLHSSPRAPFAWFGPIVSFLRFFPWSRKAL